MVTYGSPATLLLAFAAVKNGTRDWSASLIAYMKLITDDILLLL